MVLIYKIFRADEMADFLARGTTDGSPADRADGFIHFSSAGQLDATAEKHFAGEDGLTVLMVEGDTLGDALRWEPSRGGELFPHLYRELRVSEVVSHQPMAPVAARNRTEPPEHDYVDPERAQFNAFKALDRDHPIEMLNLVRLRVAAAYPPGHELRDAGLTGAEAYDRYGAETAPILERLGGSIVWRGGFESTLIGPGAERWDRIFVARYPTAHAFLAMVTDPDYRRAVVHRQAAVRTSRLIRCAPAEARAGFA